MSTKQEDLQALADAHSELDSGIVMIATIVSPEEFSEDEPVKLLEVNENSVACGIFPVSFGPGGQICHSSTIVDVTPSEFREIESGSLPLPDGWQVGQVLYRRDA